MQDINERRSVAYFSMEIGIDERICTYSGGLGVLAGDTIRSAADLKVPMVAVTLLYRKGYFRQRLEADGWQQEEIASWAVEALLEEEPARTRVLVEGRIVHLRAWRYDVKGIDGYTVPIYFLDADLPENSEWDRGLTQTLYGGDDHYRISQEVILGIGGVRMLRALGYNYISPFHLNEGHAALLTLELLDETAKGAGRESILQEDVELVRNQCVFTTHTPVPAGHDKFPLALARKVIGDRDDFFGLEGVLYEGATLNMTYLALRLSRYINGVARKHGEVSRLMFAGYAIDAITNGVHASTWVSGPFRDLFDRTIPFWRKDNFSLRYALSIPMEASGTSGMKAALNGVPNLSVLDGWWIEGHIEGLTGWSIGASTRGKGENRDHSLDAPSLYDKLEYAVVPLFYHDHRSFMDMMAYSIAINGSFFNTQRMVQEYVLNAYFTR